MPPKNKRVRRRPEDARRLILDAAEASIAADGPAGLRLQEVARVAGVSHPTILHHFGNREGLVRALNLRTLEHLKAAVIQQMGSESSGDGIRSTFAAYREGLAQRTLWLLQSAELPAGGLAVFDEIVRALHAERLRHAKSGAAIDIDDSRAIAHLTVIAAFGDALIGPRMRQVTDDKERAARERFEQWFSDLLMLHMRAKT